MIVAHLGFFDVLLAVASLVEMRSRSRQGIGDLGANYRRIKALFATLEASAGT